MKVRRACNSFMKSYVRVRVSSHRRLPFHSSLVLKKEVERRTVLFETSFQTEKSQENFLSQHLGFHRKSLVNEMLVTQDSLNSSRKEHHLYHRLKRFRKRFRKSKISLWDTRLWSKITNSLEGQSWRKNRAKCKTFMKEKLSTKKAFVCKLKKSSGMLSFFFEETRPSVLFGQ